MNGVGNHNGKLGEKPDWDENGEPEVSRKPPVSKILLPPFLKKNNVFLLLEEAYSENQQASPVGMRADYRERYGDDVVARCPHRF